MPQTVRDWLDRAHAAAPTGDVAEVERCLDAAAALASASWQWRAILLATANVPLGAGERLVDAVQRTLDAAAKEGELWGFHDVARVRAGTLGDRAGSREALEGRGAPRRWRTPARPR